ncbi:MAG: TIGR03084 family metal-binding protein, partial [Streptosporangiaceae bacterium]
MPADLRALTLDLVQESASLDAMLTALAEDQWRLPTPAPGWTIADQVSHLAYFDEATLLSIRDPERFRREAAALTGRGDDFPDQVAAEHRHLGPSELMTWHRTARRALLQGYGSADPGARLPWYGLAMGPASSITARLMETWAHGQDIADTLGLQRAATGRLRHVAHLGIRSLPYSYAVNGLPQPEAPIRVELVALDGGQWTWGPGDAGDRVTGTALDFCLVVTQRRHRTDTGLVITGETAAQWISIAQA